MFKQNFISLIFITLFSIVYHSTQSSFVFASIKHGSSTLNYNELKDFAQLSYIEQDPSLLGTLVGCSYNFDVDGYDSIDVVPYVFANNATREICRLFGQKNVDAVVFSTWLYCDDILKSGFCTKGSYNEIDASISLVKVVILNHESLYYYSVLKNTTVDVSNDSQFREQICENVCAGDIDMIFFTDDKGSLCV
jgi:hypothetical protein